MTTYLIEIHVRKKAKSFLEKVADNLLTTELTSKNEVSKVDNIWELMSAIEKGVEIAIKEHNEQSQKKEAE